jgi:phosphoglycerate transporter family protein
VKGDPAPVWRYWQLRTMGAMIVGYALYYFVRKNLSMAMPALESDLGLTKTDLGLILTLFSVIYGVGKLVNGMIADRANARYFMAIGLLGAAVVNVFFGFGASLAWFGACWLFNAYFQSMGWPPCARLLTHWYPKQRLGTWWGVWNMSHQLGGAGILVLGGYLVANHGWRSAFYVPAGLAVVGVVVMLTLLRDTPRSVGLPPVETLEPGVGEEAVADEEPELPFRRILFEQVLTNKLVWLMSLANFFVYVVRIGMLDWAPTYLVEAKGSSLQGAGWQVAGLEVAGILGSICAGVISDRVFRGNRAPVNVAYMVGLIVFVVLLWFIPAGHAWLDAAALVGVGFLVYGPQMLVSVAAADYASKKAAATATGMTGLFGYLGSAVCGIGVGLVVDRWDWDGGFVLFTAAAVGGLVLFVLALLWTRKRPPIAR